MGDTFNAKKVQKIGTSIHENSHHFITGAKHETNIAASSYMGAKKEGIRETGE